MPTSEKAMRRCTKFKKRKDGAILRTVFLKEVNDLINPPKKRPDPLSIYEFRNLETPVKFEKFTGHYVIQKSEALPVTSLLKVSLAGQEVNPVFLASSSFFFNDTVNHFNSLGLTMSDSETIREELWEGKKIFIDKRTGNLVVKSRGRGKLFTGIFLPFFKPKTPKPVKGKISYPKVPFKNEEAIVIRKTSYPKNKPVYRT